MTTKPTTRARRSRRAEPDNSTATTTAVVPTAPPQQIVVHVPATSHQDHDDGLVLPPEASMLGPEAFIGLAGMGEVSFRPAQTKVLLAPARDEELDILPTGELYPPQVHMRRRLNAAFGPGGWGLRPLANPKGQGNTIAMPWALIVGGRFAAMAWGEAEYYANNPRMSWASTIEAVKSDALKRCCKDIGVLSECWDRQFASAWRSRKCVKVYRERAKGEEWERWQWRRKDAPPFYDERRVSAPVGTRDERETWEDTAAGQDLPRGNPRGPGSAPTPRATDEPITDAERERLFTLCQEHAITAEALHARLAKIGVRPRVDGQQVTARDIPRRMFDAVCAWAMRGGR